jgi:senataxin
MQGPPGTGKTQTILGLLSVVLHSTPIKQPLMNGEVMFEQKPEISYSEKYFLTFSSVCANGPTLYA